MHRAATHRADLRVKSKVNSTKDSRSPTPPTEKNHIDTRTRKSIRQGREMVTPTPKNGDENLLKKAAISFLKLDHQLAEGPAAQAAKLTAIHCKITASIPVRKMALSNWRLKRAAQPAAG